MMSKKQTFSLRQAASNTINIPLATLHRCSPSKTFAQSHPYAGGRLQTVAFYINSQRWRYKQLLSNAIPMLEVQTVHKELLSKLTPMLEVQKQLLSKGIPAPEVQTVVFYSHPCAGGTISVQTVVF